MQSAPDDAAGGELPLPAEPAQPAANPDAGDRPPPAARPSVRTLLIGLAVAVVAGLGILLVAGTGAAGVAAAALVQAALVYLLYRWSPAP